jgi:hypothetical protein
MLLCTDDPHLLEKCFGQYLFAVPLVRVQIELYQLDYLKKKNNMS